MRPMSAICFAECSSPKGHILDCTCSVCSGRSEDVEQDGVRKGLVSHHQYTCHAWRMRVVALPQAHIVAAVALLDLVQAIVNAQVDEDEGRQLKFAEHFLKSGIAEVAEMVAMM